MLKGFNFACAHRQMRRVYIRISITWSANIWESHFFAKLSLHPWLNVNIYNMTDVSASIYLVSSVPKLPLFSRNPNITLAQEDWRYTWKETDMRHIRGDGNIQLQQSHSDLKHMILITVLYITNMCIQFILLIGLAKSFMWCQSVSVKAICLFCKLTS